MYARKKWENYSGTFMSDTVKHPTTPNSRKTFLILFFKTIAYINIELQKCLNKTFFEKPYTVTPVHVRMHNNRIDTNLKIEMSPVLARAMEHKQSPTRLTI